MKCFDLRRCRYRDKVYSENDVGPEGGYFRYDISLGRFTSLSSCFKRIALIEGVSLNDVRRGVVERGRYVSELKPIGLLTFNECWKINGKYLGKIPATYWDEYSIEIYHESES